MYYDPNNIRKHHTNKCQHQIIYYLVVDVDILNLVLCFPLLTKLVERNYFSYQVQLITNQNIFFYTAIISVHDAIEQI